MDRMQAVMAVIEGYSEHVMDALGAECLPAYDGLREAMDAPPREPLRARAPARSACSGWT